MMIKAGPLPNGQEGRWFAGELCPFPGPAPAVRLLRQTSAWLAASSLVLIARGVEA
ncbi:MAG: hypothetical protein ACK4GM_01310 [Tabrizicola sp.]